MSTYYLFESAAGFALFQSDNIDETNIKMKQLQDKISNATSFQQICRLTALLPFETAEIALNNTQQLQLGVATQELVDFLQQNLPQQGKKSSVFTLACQDNKIALALQEALNIKSKNNEVTQQVFRGIREHYVHLIRDENFKDKDLQAAQLGLAHSLSRSKIKLDINREDKHITQAICIIEQSDKDLNTLCMRIKEWYSWHLPELARIVTDNLIYVKLVDLLGNKNDVTEDYIPQIEEITSDADIAKQIYEAVKISMGQDIAQLDLVTLKDLCTKVISQFEFRSSVQEYLKQKMMQVSPNLTSLVGENVGAKLISHAGSLISLSKYPASTIQILGAEKALFRALKTKGNTPKYGLLYHSSFIGRAAGKDKGKISRNLANKCAIAARLDNFLIQPTDKFGLKMKEQVEERLKFLTAGGPMAKNSDAMDEVLNELKTEGLYIDSEKPVVKKTKKTKKSRKVVIVEEEVAVEEEKEIEEVQKPKKKKKIAQ